MFIFSLDVLMSCLCSLWEEEMREMQSCGCDIAHKYWHVLLGTEEGDFKMGVACVQHLITSKSWWDSVDALSYPGKWQASGRSQIN